MSQKLKSPQPVPVPMLESEGRDEGMFNPLDPLLGYQLRRASCAMFDDLGESLAGLDLRIVEASVLLVIDANPDITQSEIGRVLSIQRANMVPLATRLERCGFIRKAATTGRAQALRVTLKGQELVEACQRRIAAHEARFLPDLDKAERDALIGQLRQIWDK
jgi:DNA-binding MarR family transcriptional regulator